MAMFMAAEKFLAKYLGGRAQEGGTPEAVARLKEITVDPKTVVLAKKVDASTVGLPKTAMDLTARHLQIQSQHRGGRPADCAHLFHHHSGGQRSMGCDETLDIPMAGE